MAGPFDDLIPGNSAQPASGPIYGPPLHPTPQNPNQSLGVDLNNEQTRQQISNFPLQQESTRTNIEQNRQSMQNQRFNQNQGLRQEFDKLPQVSNYGVALGSLATALKAPDTPQGDLALIYAYAKAADPGSVVREGEMDMATATASLPQQFQADAQRLTQGKRLPPQVRLGLIEAMRQSVAGLRVGYDQQRARFADVAQRNGMDPDSVLGPPLYDAVRPLEENYILSHGQTPRDPNAPNITPEQTQSGFGLQQNPNIISPEQEARDKAFVATNPTPEQYAAFLGALQRPGAPPVDVGEAKARLDALRSGAAYNPSIGPDPRAQALADQYMQQGGSGGAALTVGAADAASLGSADELGAAGSALVDSLRGQGAFGDRYNVNVEANRIYEDQLRQQHPFFTGAGEVIGSAALPTFGAAGIADGAKLGAAYGSIYGFNSGEGLGNRALGAVEGGAAGGALGAALPAGVSLLRKGTQTVPPLVDPQTGELNQPLDAMSSGQRVGAMQDAGLTTITPGMAGGRSARVIEQGLNNLPGSAGVMEDVNAAASKEARSAMQNVAQQFGSSKTLSEGGSQLQRGAQERIARGKTVIGKAYDAIPISPQAQTSTANTVGTLQQLTGRFQSNPKLAESMHDPRLSQYLDAFQSGQVSWQDLKDFRSIIGEKIGDMRFGEGSSTSDLRALYGALSQDMRDTAAAQGPGALKAFERANNLNRQNEQLIQNSLTRILGKDGQMSPEKAAAAVQAMTKGGKSTGDLKTLAQIKAATVKSGAWDEIASTLIHLGGQPNGSEGRAFNPQTFVQWYADMAEPARAMLFKPELRKSLDNFVAVSQQLSRVKGLTNTSNTTPTMIGSGLVAAGGVAAVSHPVALLPLLGGGVANFGMAKLWTSPKFVQWATGFSRAASTGNPNAVKSQIGRLQAIAVSNPELRGAIVTLEQKLLSGANDNAMVGAAASQSNTEENQ